MSLTSALLSSSNALRVNQSQYGILSKNIENSENVNYVRKDMYLSSRIVGGVNLGLKLHVVRDVDERLVRDVRISQGEYSSLLIKGEYLNSWSLLVGQPQDEKSVSTKLNNFKISMQTLEGNPGSQVDQLNVVRAAENMVDQINKLATEAQKFRFDADNQIGERVKLINADLERLEVINRQVVNFQDDPAVAADLMDERDAITDRLSAEIGITTYNRENGDMVVLSKGGTTLLDGSAVLLEYTPMGGLRTSDGVDITPRAGNVSGITSGHLAGLYDIRDKTMPEFMKQLDNMASGLIRQFEAADASLAPGQAGLFTDGGNAFDPANIEGLAARLSVNAAVVPSKGGDVWKISSGIGATTPSLASDASQITAFIDAFNNPLSFGSTNSLPGNATLETYTVSMVSNQQNERVNNDTSLRVAKATASTLATTRMNRDGVNVDTELLKAQSVSDSYNASAAMLKSAQEMLDLLLSLKR